MSKWTFPDRVQLTAWLLPVLTNDLAPRLLDACTRFVDPWLQRAATERGWRLTVCDVDPETPDIVKVDLCGRLPWPDGHFGGVICSDTLEHVERPAEAVKELSRVTCAGGFLILHLPVEQTGAYSFAARSRRIEHPERHQHKHYWSIGLDAVTWATNIGYRLIGAAQGYDDERFRVRCLWLLEK